MARFPGAPVTVGGRDFEVPPLSFSAVKRFSVDGTFDRANRLTATDVEQGSTATVDAIGRIVLSALQRNYPEMREKDLDDILDAEEHYGVALGRLLGAVLKATFRERKEEAQGEPSPRHGG